MDQEFNHESPLVRNVGIFINPTPTPDMYRGTIAVNLGNGQLDPYGAINFTAHRSELRTFANKIIAEIAPSSDLISKKVVDSKNKEGRITGINKSTGKVKIYWVELQSSTWEDLSDLIVLN